MHPATANRAIASRHGHHSRSSWVYSVACRGQCGLHQHRRAISGSAVTHGDRLVERESQLLGFITRADSGEDLVLPETCSRRDDKRMRGHERCG